MAKKASMDIKWKIIGGMILALLGFAIWYYQEHHDMEDGHHGQEQEHDVTENHSTSR